MKKTKSNKKVLMISEYISWGALVLVGVLGLILNFISGNVLTGVLYSLGSLLSIAGLIFTIIYNVHRNNTLGLGEEKNFPEEKI